MKFPITTKDAKRRAVSTTQADTIYVDDNNCSGAVGVAYDRIAV